MDDYAWNLKISGGDIVVRDNELYLATRNGSKLYKVSPGDNNVEEIGQTVANVNGIALSADNDNFIMTNKGKKEVNLINPEDASTVMSYPAYKNGEEFKLYDGDLASGCADNPGGGDPDECESYVAYYANHNGGSKSEIFGLAFSGGDAVFTKITERNYEVHLTFNSDDGYIYAVNANGSQIEKISPFDGSSLGFLNLVPKGDEMPINSVYCMVYDGGVVYLGSDQRNKVYRVEFVGADAVYEDIADAPVQGGDLAVKDGRLYLATRAGNKLYEIIGGGAQLAGSIPSNVNGLAVSEDNNLISTNFNATVVYKLDDSGNKLEEYKVMGDLSQLKNGDLASGCADNGGGEPLCEIGELKNPGAEAVELNQNYIQYFPNTLPEGFGWSTTSSIEVQKSGKINGVVSYEGGYHFELLSREIGDNMYQAVATTPGSTIYLSFYHKKRPGQADSDTMEVFIDVCCETNRIAQVLNLILKTLKVPLL